MQSTTGREAGSPGPEARRYVAGKVSITRGSTVLRGAGTGWESLVRKGPPAPSAGGKIKIAGSEETYDVHMVNSDTLITLKRPFAAADVQDVEYIYFEERPAGKPIRGVSQVTESKASVSASRAAPSPIGEALRTIFYALLIALVIRAFLFQPFNIPSGSMTPTLLEGDYLFVSKWSYGFSRHSLPFSPKVFSGRLWGDAPDRGDVAVFKLPSDGRTDYIKRVIGLPGDRIRMFNGVLTINGEAVARERVGDLVQRDVDGSVRRIPQYRETLPNGMSYMTIDTDPGGDYDDTPEFVVPAGHFFMMGDNRDNSLDSRAPPNYQFPRSGGVGYVPIENLVGRAQIIFFSTDGSARFYEFWAWPFATRWSRLFDSVH